MTSGQSPTQPEGSDGDWVRSARVVLRPIASPFALGFVGLAVSTILVSGIELGWVPSSDRIQTAALILAFGPLTQVIACVFGFLARDAIAATALGIQSASWLAIGLSLLLSRPSSHGRSHELALLLFVAATALLASAARAAPSKLVPALVVGLCGLRFVLTGIYKLGAGGSGWQHAAAWTGIVLCAVALYAALSLEIEDEAHHAVLPTLRRNRGQRAFSPRLADQVDEIAAEAGVRSQL